MRTVAASHVMSHPVGRAIKDRQNVLDVFCNHFKSTDKTTDRSTPHCCPSSHTRNTERQSSQTNKIKRWKTRKERSQVKGGASNCKSHRQYQDGKEKGHCRGCCQSGRQPSQQRRAPFGHVFTAGQDPSIITDNRLIGHRGLFNHEVKSIDIERLVGEQRKLEKLGHCGVLWKKTATHPPCPPAPLPRSTSRPDVNLDGRAVPDNTGEASDESKAKTSKNNKNPFWGQTKSRGSGPGVLNTEDESRLTPSGKINKERPPDPKVTPWRPTPNIRKSSSPARDGGNVNSDNQTEPSDTNRVSAVAKLLCRSLQFPLLGRRNLVEENREVLLQTLQDRHGPKLQENLLEVQRRLRSGTGHNTTRSGQGRSRTPDRVDADRAWPAAPLDDCFGETTVKQLFEKSAPYKKRRKQIPSSLIGPEYSLNTAATWTSSPGVVQVGELFRAPPSSHFLMNFEPSSSSSPNHVFASASHSAVHSSSLQPLDRQGLNRDIMRESDGLDHFENRKYESDFSFLNQTAIEESKWPWCHDRNLQPFPQYPTGPTEKNTYKNLLKQQDSYEIEMSHSGPSSSYLPASTHYPPDSRQHHPVNHFTPPPSSLRSHLPSITYYPHSHMLESGLSPPLPYRPLSAFNSTESWSFYRMRLY
ncbi:hypothetical protein DPEC_G00144480 [Dallia pectoralis]|uniref:Uncharacterized protein n=1 Tax=Dallia pectoralis TaxID=75939 RepID=A0ACC2GP68_DALPE|nr:hypothetical protein DPEC_G00144480 [Dallia pectoralis]